MSLDRVPGTRLYIGGAITVRRQSALRDAKITHIVTAIKPPLEYHLYEGYHHYVVPVDDMEDENVIEHFPACNEFIHTALGADDGQGAVLVHCAMGKSRSATLLVAYLLWTSLHHPDSLSLSASFPNNTASLSTNNDSNDDSASSPTTQTPGSPTTNNNLPTYPLTPTGALTHLRHARPMAEPNPSFLSQLTLYHALSCPSTTAELDASPRYQRWCWERTTRTARERGEAPDLGALKLDAQGGDEGGKGNAPGAGDASQKGRNGRYGEGEEEESSKRKVYRCKRCRTQLATSAFLSTPHGVGSGAGRSDGGTGEKAGTARGGGKCSHLWLEQPLGWMRGEMEAGKLDGRLECPNRRCGTQVGRYAWQGLRCSCGEWVVPGISLGVGKVDEIMG